MATQTESVQTEATPATIIISAQDIAERLGSQPRVPLDPVKQLSDEDVQGASAETPKIRRVVDEEPNTTASVSDFPIYECFTRADFRLVS